MALTKRFFLLMSSQGSFKTFNVSYKCNISEPTEEANNIKSSQEKGVKRKKRHKEDIRVGLFAFRVDRRGDKRHIKDILVVSTHV